MVGSSFCSCSFMAPLCGLSEGPMAECCPPAKQSTAELHPQLSDRGSHSAVSRPQTKIQSSCLCLSNSRDCSHVQCLKARPRTSIAFPKPYSTGRVQNQGEGKWGPLRYGISIKEFAAIFNPLYLCTDTRNQDCPLLESNE